MAQTEPYRARKDGVVTLASQELYAEMECTQCYTRYNNFTQSAAAKNAHRHVVLTGHVVEVRQLRVRTYGPQGGVISGSDT